MAEDRRSYCPLCPSRRDPGKWCCRRCTDRIWQEILTELVEDAYAQRG